MTPSFCARFACALLLFAGLRPLAAQVPDSADAAPRRQLIEYLNSLARAHLERRTAEVGRIDSRAAAERRKRAARETVLELLGGLPAERGPLAARTTGVLAGDGFRVEKVLYESLPGYRVTANLYLPAGGGEPFPAVILTPGHDPRGKAGLYSFGANLARAGIAALAHDPISEGERLQHFDPELGASRVGRPTGEHSHAGVQTLLVGDHVSRYFVWDAVRGIDYLASRPEIDAGRIGAFGCSGGGTVTAYLAALDERVRAVATACYLTTFGHLLSSGDPQEGEQSIPSFLERELDLADWVLMAAPVPYAIVSTREDFFPFEGARRTYEEARRVYGLYGAEDRVRWITAPGGHGALGPVSGEIVSFFARWLAGDTTQGSFAPLRPERAEDLLVTPTGQLSTSLGSETVYSLNRKRAEALIPDRRPIRTPGELERLRSRLRADARAVAGITARPGDAPPAARVLESEPRAGYRLDTLELRGEDGFAMAALLAVPERAGPLPALLVMDPRPAREVAAPGGEVDRLAREGRVVLVLQPRGTPGGTEEMKSPLLGTYYLMSLRALLVGRTLLGMRADDAIRAVSWLSARPDVDRSRIAAYGVGPLGPVALHAAALDERIAAVYVERSLAAYRMAVERPLHQDLPEIALPGVLRRYDLADLALAASPRRVVLIDPVNELGEPADRGEIHAELEHVLRSDRALSREGRVRVVSRGPGGRLPLD